MVKGVALYLYREGVHAGARVAIVSANRPYFLIAIYAVFYLRAIPVSIDRELDSEMQAALVGEEPFLLIDKPVPDSYVGRAWNLEDLESIALTMDVEQFEGRIPLNFHAVEDDPVLILCSSGTTGRPKKVLYSEGNLSWADREYARLYQFDVNNSIAFVVPTHYSLGILACGIIPFFHGKTIYIDGVRDVCETLQNVTRHKIAILPGTPTLFSQMNRCKLDEMDFTSLRLCDSGGQILPVSVIERFARQTNVIITEGYGLTETSSLTHFLVPDATGRLRLGSIGIPCSDVECRIVDGQGSSARTNEPGELLVRGPQNTLGYDGTTDAPMTDADGWLHTGDVVYADNDGYYYVVSRKGDLLLNEFSAGIRLREIEERLYAEETVSECASIMTATGAVIIFVKPSTNSIDPQQERARIHALLSELLQHADEVRLVDSIPRTSTHKVRRTQLRAEIESAQ
jgi:acyl-CoA synthetase (AMP-forming)/AMP-acid ligase II